MNILTEYTWNYLKKNRKNTISILIAITIGTILLSTMVLVTYMGWDYEYQDSIERNGNYHGTFGNYIDKSQIAYLRENQKIDSVYLRSEPHSGKVDVKRPYLNISYLDKEHWRNMQEAHNLLEGRLPESSSEIVVTANFFKENPQYKLGDKINVALGDREKEGKKVDPSDITHESEIFIEKKEVEYSIVGTIYGKSVSYTPSYSSLGFLDEKSIDEDMKIAPYLKMKSPRNVYKDLPEIGKTLEFSKGEEANAEDLYGSKYNISYLKLQGIFSPSTKLTERVPFVIFVFSIFILFVILLFFIIIYNVFTVWSNNRLRQLGILKSIGATPKQIKRTVKLEAILLSIIPIALGIILGHLFCYVIMDRISSIVNSFNVEMDGSIFNLQFKTSFIVVGITIALSFLTILLSISSTASKLSKIMPIEAIKHGGLNYAHLKKKESRREDYSPTNIISSLARDSLNGNRKGFRTTIISLTLGFAIMFIFLILIEFNVLTRNLNTSEHYYNMQMEVLSNELIDENLFKEIGAIPKVEESILYKDMGLYSKVKPEYESEEFKNVGGFESIDNQKYYYNKIDGDYEVPVRIFGLNHDNFNEYLKSQGGNPEEYYNKDNPKAILLNLVKEDVKQPVVRSKFIPYLNDEVGNLSLNQSFNGEGYNFNIDIGLKTFEDPLKDYNIQDYRIYLFIPKEILNYLMEDFEGGGDYAHSETIRLLTEEKDITKVKEDIKDIAKYYIPEEDYYIWDILEEEETEEMINKVLYLVGFSIVSFIGIIGVSNAYSSINNNLRNRRREFAMLRSMGVTKKDLRKMLRLEGIYYSIYPFILSIPISIFMLFFVVKFNKVFSFKDLIMFLDYRIIAGYFIIISISIYLAYYFGIRKIEKDDIVSVLKDESV